MCCFTQDFNGELDSRLASADEAGLSPDSGGEDEEAFFGWPISNRGTSRLNTPYNTSSDLEGGGAEIIDLHQTFTNSIGLPTKKSHVSIQQQSPFLYQRFRQTAHAIFPGQLDIDRLPD